MASSTPSESTVRRSAKARAAFSRSVKAGDVMAHWSSWKVSSVAPSCRAILVWEARQ
ncbi:hypothetical protein D3C86_2037670 [compost metagenome]